ncbi:P-loop NTPase fold protein [Catellatospora sp. KI3]|uniref:P-loop NTPase fold protein n=1 Tax=Catellatospora sp. KI3 TaxID=3041620 RepID=UPI002482EF45|nr:P-loop NTPase fold protein [Catellatospora sp. KI3]MDI1463088.1 P-loop NTPase fold protein [Catellatospora sp. KI3]
MRVDQDLILAAGRSQGVDLIEARSRQLIRIVAAGVPVTALAALPGGTHGDRLLVGGPNGEIREINPGNGHEIRRLAHGRGEIRDFAVGRGAGGGDVVVVARETGVSLWDPHAAKDPFTELVADVSALSARPFKVCLYRHGGRPYAACALTDGAILTWNLDDPGAEPVVTSGHNGPIWTVVALPAGPDGDQLIASGSSDQVLKVWQPTGEGRLRQLREYHTGGTIRRLGHVVDAGVSMLVTASARGPVSLWRYDGPTERPAAEVALHSGEVYAVACETLPDGILVASGDFNGDIKINRLTSSVLLDQQKRDVTRIPNTIWAVTGGTTESGDFYACAGVNRVIYVVDPATQQHRHKLEGHDSTVRALAFGGTPDNPHLLSGGADHRVYDWHPETGWREELRMGHEAEVWALATAEHQGRWYAISGGPDGTVRTCPLDDPNDMRILAEEVGEVSSLAVSYADDEVRVVIGSTQGLFRIPLLGGEQRTIETDSIADVATLRGAPRQAGRPDTTNLVVVARTDGNVELYDIKIGVLVKRFAMPVTPETRSNRQVRAVSMHRTAQDDVLVFGGCDNGELLKWDLDGQLIGQASKPAGSDTSVRDLHVMHPSATEDVTSGLLSGGHDGVLRLWPISKDKPLSSGGVLESPVEANSILLQDQPADSDLLARAALTKTLVSALRSAEPIAPVVVGVHAPWGQGKSSILRQIRAAVDAPGSREKPSPQELQTHRLVMTETGRPVTTNVTPTWAWKRLQERAAENELPYRMRPADGKPTPITAWFNPWMYEERNQIWAGLTNEILTAITRRLPQAERRRLFIDLNLKRTNSAEVRKQILDSYRPHTLRGIVGLGAAALALVAAVVATMVAIVNTGELDKILGSAALIFLAALGIVIRLVATSVKGFNVWYDPLADSGPRMGGVSANGASGDPLETPDRGYLYLLRHDVREVIDLIADSPLYIFIDDMDRCSPGIVADTIEAINLFLTKAFGPCIFVMGLDPATVAAHLESHLPAIDQRAKEDPVTYRHLRHTGWRFMEKIVDLPVRLPRVTDIAMRSYLDQLLLSNRVQSRVVVPQEQAPPADRRRGFRKPKPQAAPAAPPAPPVVAAAIPAQRAAATTTAPATQNAESVLDRLEDIPVVRDALHEAVQNLPGRNPRQIKAFVNLWRFYMALEHELGATTSSLSGTQVHSAEMARLVEIMVRWPWLLDPLGFRRVVKGKTVILLELLLKAAPDRSEWERVVKEEGMDADDEDLRGLRELLTRRGADGPELVSIARRYL